MNKIENIILKIKNFKSLTKLDTKDQSNFIKSIFCIYLCTAFVLIFLGIVLNQILNVPETTAITENLDKLEYIIIGAFSTVLLVPILEEFAFRLQLTDKYLKQMIGTYLMVLVFSLFIGLNFFWEVGFFILCSLPFIYYQNLNNQPSMYRVNWTTILTFTSLFTLAHVIKNYQIYNINDWRLIILLPFSVLPQFIFGIVLSLVRININLWNSIKLHIFNNFLAFAPSVIMLIPVLSYENKLLLVFGFVAIIPIYCILFVLSSRFCEYQT